MKSININKLIDIENPVIIDVREVYEYESNHIKGSINLPLSTLESSYAAVLNKNQVYYIMCQAGGRSSMACDFLTDEGYNVINLEGGMSGYFQK